ncbi:MAG: hypothetical protein C9356_12510 [Oleiphilus sp.]|nr:MAG: hypothetical protein C9356_12510 [Oleiphilus sp.]
MSWIDQLLPASFGGQPFFVDVGSSGGFGRRYELTNYPFSDRFDVEDLGRENSVMKIRAFLLDDGQDSLDRRHDALVAMIDAGENTLVHPRLGQMRVLPGRCTYTFVAGRIRYDLEFLPPQNAPIRSEQTETSAQVDAAATAAQETVQLEAAEQLQTDQRNLLEAVQEQVHVALDTVREVNGSIDAALAPVSELALTIDAIGDQVVDLIRTPSELINRMASLYDNVLTLNDDIDQALVSVRGLKIDRDYSEPVGLTAQLRQQNQQALDAATNTALIASSARLVAAKSARLDVNSNADSPFDSYGHAVAVRDELLALIDQVLPIVGHASYAALLALRSQIYQHIDAHGMRLPRIERVQFGQGLPAWAIAHQVYGDARLMDDLVRRNQIAQPCYIAADTELEILRNA